MCERERVDNTHTYILEIKYLTFIINVFKCVYVYVYNSRVHASRIIILNYSFCNIYCLHMGVF